MYILEFGGLYEATKVADRLLALLRAGLNAPFSKGE